MTLVLALLAFALAPSEDRMAMPMPPGFVTGYSQTAQVGSIEERIPEGETVEQWSRMITLLEMNTIAQPGAYLDSFVAAVSRACPGATAAPRAKATVGGHAAIDGRLDCPLNPSTGKPETFFFRIFAAGGKLHMAQVAFRHMPDDAEARWARAQLAGVTF